MSANKNHQKKPQDPPAGQPTGESVPLAAKPPALEDRVRALELANIELEEKIRRMEVPFLKLYRVHNGGHDPYEDGGISG